MNSESRDQREGWPSLTPNYLVPRVCRKKPSPPQVTRHCGPHQRGWEETKPETFAECRIQIVSSLRFARWIDIEGWRDPLGRGPRTLCFPARKRRGIKRENFQRREFEIAQRKLFRFFLSIIYHFLFIIPLINEKFLPNRTMFKL